MFVIHESCILPNMNVSRAIYANDEAVKRVWNYLENILQPHDKVQSDSV